MRGGDGTAISSKTLPSALNLDDRVIGDLLLPALQGYPASITEPVPRVHNSKKIFAWPSTHLHHHHHHTSITTMSSFFTIPGGSAKKRKRTGPTTAGARPKKQRETYTPTNKKRQPDEDISSESGGESDGGKAQAAREDDEDVDEELENETSEAQRMRLAQQYLSNLHQEAGL